MKNLKHTIAGVLAVAMIGSLAVTQATTFQSVDADKLEQENATETVVTVGDLSDKSLEDFGFGKYEIGGVVDVLEYESGKLPFIEKMGYVVSKDGAAVRLKADVEEESIAVLSCAEEILVTDEEGDWFEVSYNNRKAYIPKELITFQYEEAKQVLLEYYMYETGIVTVDADFLNVRSAASVEDTQILDQIKPDTAVVVAGRVEDWLKIYYGEDYDFGYVLAEHVTIGDMTPKAAFNESRMARMDAIAKGAKIQSNGKAVSVYYMPNTETLVLGTLEDAARCQVLSKGSNWTKIVFGEDKTCAYVQSSYVLTDEEVEQARKKAEQEAARKAAEQAAKNNTSTTKSKAVPVASTGGSTSGQAIVNTAAQYIGTPYVYGGTTPSGFDCSGLVQYVCRKVGISVNRTSRAQYSNGVPVSRDNLQPGDLVFFAKGKTISHVVIYAGNGQVIHAPSPGKKVTYASLNHIASYSNYVGARRVV